jgi:hypothetical protein
MLQVEYLYIPLSGKAYISLDICNSLEVEMLENNMKLIFMHKIENKENLQFTSSVIIPHQKISVQEYSE